MTIEQLEKRILDRVEDTMLGVFIIDAFEQYNRSQASLEIIKEVEKYISSCEADIGFMGSKDYDEAKETVKTYYDKQQQ